MLRSHVDSPVAQAARTLVGVLAMMCAASVQARAPQVPPTTPPGVTLVEVVRELNASEPKLLWVRPGDATGNTLLMSDHDTPHASRCVGACAQEFLPLRAARGARAFGDWSLVMRPDGMPQWAYQSHPLYTWTKEQISGEVATNVALSETANLKLAEDPVQAGALLPPAGWQVVRFTPAATKTLPDGIDLQLVDSAQAVALVDANGLTLYSFDGDVRHDGQECAANGCRLQWVPLAAPALGIAVGDFSIVTRDDGSRQWTYKGRPLYLYGGDQLAGDAHGIGVDPRWAVAALSENFRPANTSVTTFNGYGDALSWNGKTLYGSYPFEKRWGGRNLRETFSHNAYAKGKRLGASACADSACLQRWQPFLAPASAQSAGLWEIVTRPDGSRQWAYKGYALYTYRGDRSQGDHTGQATYDFHDPEGNYKQFQQALFLANFAQYRGGAGIYWNIAKP
jgi:predicted lipoprotein with Yx(FWY)xxD motif